LPGTVRDAAEPIIRDHRDRGADWERGKDCHDLAVDLPASFGMRGNLPLQPCVPLASAA
jgi:hypothetical protein